MSFEQRMELLSEDVRFTATPDFAMSIGGLLPPRVSRIDWQRRLLIAAAIVVVVLVAALGVPESRSAIAKWMGLGGIRIEFVDRLLDRDDRVEIDSSLIVGEEIGTNEDAFGNGRTVFGLSEIEPERVFWRAEGEAEMLTLLYLPSESLPEIGGTGVGVLLMHIETPADFYFLVKESWTKGEGTVVTVNGIDGYWVETGNLIAVPYDPKGVYGLDAVSRPTGNVLLWQSGGITYRLETNLDRDAAIELAESLVPIETN